MRNLVYYYLQQKLKRHPLQIHERDQKEIGKVLSEMEFGKTRRVEDELFNHSKVNTSKKERGVKIAMDTRKLNKSIVKRQPQMPYREQYIHLIAEYFDKIEGEAWVSFPCLSNMCRTELNR